jgi:hypothetical protein
MYQVMPALADEEYAALKADIAARGVLVPVELDEGGAILDGYHRVRAWEELRAEGVAVPDYPRMIRPGLSETEKRAHARTLNLARRHLSQEQRRELIRQQIQETPERSNRQIAALLGVSHPTVAVVRCELELAGQVVNLTTSQGADGKTYPRPQDPPDWWHWAEAQLGGPFTREDFDDGMGWIKTKLLHHLRAPAATSCLLRMADEFQVPALRLAPADELAELLRLAWPFAKSTETFETVSVSLVDMVALKLCAQRICVLVFDELERREKGRRRPSGEAVHRQLMQRIDAALAGLSAGRSPA